MSVPEMSQLLGPVNLGSAASYASQIEYSPPLMFLLLYSEMMPYFL